MDYLDLPEDLGKLEYLRRHPGILIEIAKHIRRGRGIQSFKECLIWGSQASVSGLFTWSNTPEGAKVWSDISNSLFDEFYVFHKGTYDNPDKKVKEEKNMKYFMTFNSYEKMLKSSDIFYGGKYKGQKAPHNWSEGGYMDFLFDSTFEITEQFYKSLEEGKTIQFKGWYIYRYMLCSLGGADSLKEYMDRIGKYFPESDSSLTPPVKEKRYIVTFKSYDDMLESMGEEGYYDKGEKFRLPCPTDWETNGNMDYLYGKTVEISKEAYEDLVEDGCTSYIPYEGGTYWYASIGMLSYYGEDLECSKSLITGLQTGDEEETPLKALPMKEVKTNLFN